MTWWAAVGSEAGDSCLARPHVASGSAPPTVWERSGGCWAPDGPGAAGWGHQRLAAQRGLWRGLPRALAHRWARHQRQPALRLNRQPGRPPAGPGRPPARQAVPPSFQWRRQCEWRGLEAGSTWGSGAQHALQGRRATQNRVPAWCCPTASYSIPRADLGVTVPRAVSRRYRMGPASPIQQLAALCRPAQTNRADLHICAQEKQRSPAGTALRRRPRPPHRHRSALRRHALHHQDRQAGAPAYEQGYVGRRRGSLARQRAWSLSRVTSGARVTRATCSTLLTALPLTLPLPAHLTRKSVTLPLSTRSEAVRS